MAMSSDKYSNAVAENPTDTGTWSIYATDSSQWYTSASYEYVNASGTRDVWSELPDIFKNYSSAEPTRAVPTAFKIVFGVFLGLFIVAASVGNSVVCYIVYQKKTMRSAINLLLANMAFSNILLATFCMPFSLTTLIAEIWVFGDIMCKIEGFLQSLFMSEGVLMLLVISTHRYMIIVVKKDTLTPSRAKVTIYVTWACAALLSLPPTLGWSGYTSHPGWMICALHEYTNLSDKVYVVLYHTLIFFLPTTILTFCFLSIIRVVHRRRLRIHSQPQNLVIPAPKRGLSISSLPRVSVDMNLKIRAFKTICILSGLFILCWLPYGVSLTLWNLKHLMASRYIGGNIVTWLGYLNCALNPVIYCVRIRKFRQACLEMIPRSIRGLPPCPSNAKRRINPGTAYEYSDSQQSQQQSQLASVSSSV